MYDIRCKIIYSPRRSIKLRILRSRFTVINRPKIITYDNRGWYSDIHSKIKSKDTCTINDKIYINYDVDGYQLYPTSSSKTMNELCEENDDDYY